MSAIAVQDCWNRIGVQGNKSCPELARHIHCRNCPTFEQGAQTLLNRAPPDGYIEEWTGFLAGAKEKKDGFTATAFVFRVGPEWLALNARLCVEIVSNRPIRRIPHRSDGLLMGLAGVRGELLLCFSLSNLLGLETSGKTIGQNLPRLLVTRKDRLSMALPVDEVMGLLPFHQDALRAIPATVAHAVPQFSRGMLTAAGRTIGLLDEELVFHALKKA